MPTIRLHKWCSILVHLRLYEALPTHCAHTCMFEAHGSTTRDRSRSSPTSFHAGDRRPTSGVPRCFSADQRTGDIWRDVPNRLSLPQGEIAAHSHQRMGQSAGDVQQGSGYISPRLHRGDCASAVPSRSFANLRVHVGKLQPRPETRPCGKVRNLVPSADAMFRRQCSS
jgi:hypothetical protein